MGTYLIMAVLIICVAAAMMNSAKHFRGEGGCCGGGTEHRVKKQRLKQVMKTKEIAIEGMSCEHCKNRVENALNLLEHVNAKVNLKEKKVIVKMEKDIPDEVLQSTVEQAGYQVVSVKETGKW